MSQELVELTLVEEEECPPCPLPSLGRELHLLLPLVSWLLVQARKRQTWAGSRSPS